MIKLIYEDEYGNTTINYECDATSLEGRYDTTGVLEHLARFLAAAGYPIERNETLVPFNGDNEYIIEHAEWHELQRKLDECRGYRVWWSDYDEEWIAENPNNPSLKARSAHHPSDALAKLHGIEVQESTNASSPIEPPSQDGWIPWHGGECPVDPGVEVDIRLRNGEVHNGSPAGGWNWAHIDDASDIIAYRVVEEDT
jgi:hypothetical protein